MCRKADGPGAVFHMHQWCYETIEPQGRDDLFKVLELFPGENGVFIRHRQMGRNTSDAHARQLAYRAHRVARFLLPDPDAAHTRVDLDVDLQRIGRRQTAVGRRLFQIRNKRQETLRRDRAPLLWECRSENHHRKIRHNHAHLACLDQIRHAKHLHLTGERLRDSRSPMAIGIRFDDRDHAGLDTHAGTDCRKILPEGGEIDFRPGPRWSREIV